MSKENPQRRLRAVLHRRGWRVYDLEVVLRRRKWPISQRRLHEIVLGSGRPTEREMVILDAILDDRPVPSRSAAPRVLTRSAPSIVEPRSVDRRLGARADESPPPSAGERCPLLDVPCEMTVDELAVWSAVRPDSRSSQALESLGMPPTRRTVAQEELLPSPELDHPLDRLLGRRLGPAFWQEVWRFLPGDVQHEELQPGLRIDPTDHSGLLAAVRRAAEMGDGFSQVVVAMAVAATVGCGQMPAHLVQADLDRWALGEASPTTNLLASAMGVMAARWGIPGAPRLKPEVTDPQWLFGAGFWSAPLRHLSSRQLALLEAVLERDMGWLSPWDVDFAAPSDEVVDHALGLVEATRADRSVQSREPEFLNDPALPVQVILVEDDDLVTAWVGADNLGVLVGFAPDDPLPIGIPGRGMAGAAIAALGWHLDLSRSGARAAHYDALSQSHSYRARASWRRQHEQVQAGQRRPQLAHFVRPHVRRYAERMGTDEARSRAPRGIRELLGPHDTWVRGHWAGDGGLRTAVRENVARASVLADLLGLVDRTD